MVFVRYKCTNGNVLIYIRALRLPAGNVFQKVFRKLFERDYVSWWTKETKYYKTYVLLGMQQNLQLQLTVNWSLEGVEMG